jgi:energy-converting hydrogenase Eha subunit A
MQGPILRAILIAAFMIAIGAICVQFWLFGYSKVEWNTVAASLAVITAIISAWTTQTSFERQEEAQRPYPYPTLDA